MNITKLIVKNQLTELIQDIKDLSSTEGLEYGFNIFYLDDGILFPGFVCRGGECEIQMNVDRPFLSNVFGGFHTHTISRKIKECTGVTDEEILMAINRNQSSASINDLMTSIEDLFLRGSITDSAVLVISDVDLHNNLSIYIPKRANIQKFRDAIHKIQQSPDLEYKRICDIVIDPDEEEYYNYVFDLFYSFKVSIPSERDIVIERNNETFEYNLNYI
jgi:hypothetical protein